MVWSFTIKIALPNLQTFLLKMTTATPLEWSPEPRSIEKAEPSSASSASSEASTLLKAQSKSLTRNTTEINGSEELELNFSSIYEKSTKTEKPPEKFDDGSPQPVKNLTIVLPDGTSVEKSADGALIAKDADGKVTSFYKPIESIKGQYIKQIGEDDSVTHAYVGAGIGNNFILEETKDGKLTLTDANKEVSEFTFTDRFVVDARKSLLDKATKHIDDPAQLAKFKADMIRFENRASKDNLSDVKVADTYMQLRKLFLDENPADTYMQQLSKLFFGDPKAKIGLDERTKIASDAIGQAAIPTSIDQGYHNTCNVATIESKMYTQEPAEAIRLLAYVAHNGQFKTSEGYTVKIDEGSLKADFEANNHPTADGKRSHASQIFQVSAVNAVHTSEGKGLRYRQEAKDVSDSKDTGERLYSTKTYPPELIDKTPSLGGTQITDAYRLISGKNIEDTYLSNSISRGVESAGSFDSPETLDKNLIELKKAGKLPAILSVNTKIEPFYTDSGDGTAGGSDGWHVVTVTDYDPKTKMLSVDNQWGSSTDRLEGDRRISLNDTFLASMSLEDELLYKLGKEVDKEFDKEFPGLTKTQSTLKIVSKLLDNPKWGGENKGLEAGMLVSDIDAEWLEQQDNGTFDKAEFEKTNEIVGEIFDKLPVNQQFLFLAGRLFKNGRVTAKSFELNKEFYQKGFEKAAAEAGLNQADITRELNSKSTTQSSDQNISNAATILKMLPEDVRKSLVASLPKGK